MVVVVDFRVASMEFGDNIGDEPVGVIADGGEPVLPAGVVDL